MDSFKRLAAALVIGAVLLVGCRDKPAPKDAGPSIGCELGALLTLDYGGEGGPTPCGPNPTPSPTPIPSENP